MPEKSIPPSLGANSLSCPHCGAVAHQTWYYVILEGYDKDNRPWMPEPDVLDQIEMAKEIEDKGPLKRHFEQILAKALFLEVLEKSGYSKRRLHSLYVSRCYSCEKYALWLADAVIYPASATEIEPNDEMPDEVRLDFVEAASIVDKSPRGAAALLRLSIQKLIIHLKLKGKNLDHDIGELMKRGLDARIQKALDVVRVVGNNVSTPGKNSTTRRSKNTPPGWCGRLSIGPALWSAPRWLTQQGGNCGQAGLW